MLPSRWLADEMLGRLSRYMRFVGLDVEYVRGLTDAELLDRARDTDRTVVTRDVRLARAAPGGVLLTSPELERQWRQLRAQFPNLPTRVSLTRCTLCNGELEPARREAQEGGERMPTEKPVYACRGCGHRYWQGSHTDEVQRRISAWSTTEGP